MSLKWLILKNNNRKLKINLYQFLDSESKFNSCFVFGYFKSNNNDYYHEPAFKLVDSFNMTETSRQAAEFIMAAEFDSINSHYDKGSIKTKNFIFLISSKP